MRCKDVRFCAIGMMAIYLFWRYHVDGEEESNFRRNDTWFDVVLLTCVSPNEAYETEIDEYGEKKTKKRKVSTGQLLQETQGIKAPKTTMISYRTQ